MSAKMDGVHTRTPQQLEQKFDLGKRFAEIMGIATGARNAAEDAKNAVGNLDGNLTAEEIFNRLTENGKFQGLYRGDDGELYINATYIKSGEFVADLIKTGILKDKDGEGFYLNLDNGTLKANFTELKIAGKSVSQAALDGQTQLDIFNKLTKNGTLQGIYMEGGKIYINAEYIRILEKLFAKDINMSGKFTHTAKVFLEPEQTEVDRIQRHLLGTEIIPTNQISLYDFNNDGKISVIDLAKAQKAKMGVASLSTWSGAVKTDVTLTIDMSNPDKAVRITGTNMWGRAIDKYIGVNFTNIKNPDVEQTLDVLNKGCSKVVENHNGAGVGYELGIENKCALVVGLDTANNYNIWVGVFGFYPASGEFLLQTITSNGLTAAANSFGTISLSGGSGVYNFYNLTPRT